MRATTAVLALALASLGAQAQLVPVKTVDLGVFHGCSLSESGAVSCWGANNAGQIGDGTTGTDHSFPIEVASAVGKPTTPRLRWALVRSVRLMARFPSR